MAKNISVLGAVKCVLLLLIMSGVGLFSGSFLRFPADILLAGLMTFMVAEDWLYQTIDVPKLGIMTALLLYGAEDRAAFLIKYVFIWIFFRSCFLWLMRFEPPSNDLEDGFMGIRRIQTGFLPFFCLSFCLAYLQSISNMDIFKNIYLGYLMAADQVVSSSLILPAMLAVLVIILLAGERRRRMKSKELAEIWPFGDGDVWFLAAWGAAMSLGDFFLVFLISQLVLLITYLIKYFLDGDLQNE